LALPTAGFSNDIIFAAYQQQFNLLTAKGYKIPLNMMDNQAMKVIKAKQLTVGQAPQPPHHHC
jgi:hypothetical protein